MQALDHAAHLAASPGGALSGLLLGVLGFGVTLWQIRTIKTVTNAQREAILGLKFRMSQLDVVAECTKADAALGDLKKHLLEADSEPPLDVCDRLATAFISILEGSTAISDEVRTRLRAATSDINKLTETSTRVRPEARSTSKQMAALRDYHGIIVKIRAQVQEEQSL